MYHPKTGQVVANVVLKQRYRVITSVGSGGMGAVYKAEDIQLGNRLVALKEMRQSGMDAQQLPQAVAAFRKEATMLARLQHPNLPSIFDHFEENGRWYLVMSFLEGETLQDYLNRKGGKLPLDEALQIGIQLCTVLGYLHQQQPAPIIFRDLKPANIMRTADGHIYLIDFGIARHFKPEQAKDTAYYASMGYAPPEQYGLTQTTPRSDIYSLGVVLHQMLSGRNPSLTPFHFPSLLSLSPALPARLAALVSQMLDPDPQKRPANVLAVRQVLQDLISAQVPPPPPTALPARRILPTMAAGGPQVYAPGYRPTVAARPSFYPPAVPAPRPRRRGSWLLLLVSIGGIVVIVSGLILFLTSSHSGPLYSGPSYPHLASSYQGTIRNATGTSAALFLTFTQNQQQISGRMTLSSGQAAGGGSLTGTVGTDNSLRFTVTADDGLSTIDMSGTVSPQNTLSGTYRAHYTGQILPDQTGTWDASPSTSS
jgi:serine/threonine protein kinase